jgi:flagellar operon protein (TIGR03826 family)
MDVRNCKRCGKMYQFVGSYICMNCIRQDDEDFRKVKEYVLDHAGSSPVDVSEATGVDIKTISRFLREGRLEAEGLDLAVDEDEMVCENCRRPIPSGRFCESCLHNLQQQFKKASESLEPEKKPQVEKSFNRKEVLHTYDVILKQKP